MTTHPTLLAVALAALAGCGAVRAATPPAAAHHAHHAAPHADAPPAAEGARPTTPFRQAHRHLIAALDRAERDTAALSSVAPAELPERVHEVVRFFHHQLAPHAQGEEAVLYPVVDRVVGAPAPHRYTDTLRHDHTIVAREIDALHAWMASGDRTPAGLAAFQRRVFALIGLVRAHFAAEEDVLLDTLDARMTADAFAREVMEPTARYEREHGGGHGHHEE